jgi:hypothetical protein
MRSPTTESSERTLPSTTPEDGSGEAILMVSSPDASRLTTTLNTSSCGNPSGSTRNVLRTASA